MSASPSKTGATLANVAASTTSVTLFAAGTGAPNQRIVFNDSNVAMYIAFGAAAASTTNFTVKIAAGGYYEFPIPIYNGACTAIWDATATGAARVTSY